MPTIVKNQAVKLYDASETLFNDKTSRCEWHQDYFPLVTCDDVSEIILNMDEIANDVGKDSDFSFVVTGTITNIVAFFVDDSAATFISDNVEVGMYINVIDGITGGILFSQKIIDVVSETQLEVATTGDFSSGEDYEVSNWAYFGDVTTVNNSFEITSLGISSSFIFQETLTVGVLYKIEFTITFVDVDLDGNTLDVLIGSNNVLSLFESEIQAKKYTVFGIADATVFRITTGDSIKLTIQSIVVSEMAETTFEVRNCDTDVVEYSSVANDFVYSNVQDQLKMSINWANITPCEGCHYINVEQMDDVEYIVNGAFDTDTDWTTSGAGTPWFIANGKANMPISGGSERSLISENPFNLSIGRHYEVSFEIVDYDFGDLLVKLFNGVSEELDLGTFTALGAYTIQTGELLTDIDQIRFVTFGGNVGYSIDNVSIREIKQLRTDCMNLSDSYDCTVKLSGTNNDNAFGIDFESLVYSPFIRVAGELMTPKYDGDKENEEDSQGISKTLYFKSETKRDLFLYQLPIFHHEFIRLLIGYDTLLIDDVEYVSTGASYEPEVERVLGKISDLSNSTTELRLEDDLNENKFC